MRGTPASITVEVVRERPPRRHVSSDDIYEDLYEACIDVFQREEPGAWYRIAEIRGGASSAAHTRIGTLKRKHPELIEFHQLQLRGAWLKDEQVARIYVRWHPPTKSLTRLRDVTERRRRRSVGGQEGS